MYRFETTTFLRVKSFITKLNNIIFIYLLTYLLTVLLTCLYIVMTNNTISWFNHNVIYLRYPKKIEKYYFTYLFTYLLMYRFDTTFLRVKNFI